MGHRIDDEVHSKAIGSKAILQWIIGLLDPLPRVAVVLIARYEDDDPLVLIEDRLIIGDWSVVPLGGLSISDPIVIVRDLRDLINIKVTMKDGMG